MLKGAKKKLGSSDSTNIFIMPSTKNLSGLMNSLGALMFLGAFFLGMYIMGFFALVSGSVYVGAAMILGTFLFGRLIDLFVKDRKNRRGYIKVDRNTAFALIDVEAAYAGMSSEDKAIYKNYLEGAFYGDATPKKVAAFFRHKRVESVQKPKALDELIDMELPKD